MLALIWAAGWRRSTQQRDAGAWADLLALGLAVPILVAGAHTAGVFPDVRLRVVRVAPWNAAITGVPGLETALDLLWVGTLLLFVVQELVPAWRSRRESLGAQQSDVRLDAALDRVLRAYAPLQVIPKPPRIMRVEVPHAMAGLSGIRRPVILISAPLLAQLDEHELDGAVAHELAHLARGGNLRAAVMWLGRALQACSPATLVLFRMFVQAQEAACDELAVRVTGRPAALASALLKAHGGEGTMPTGAVARARYNLLRHADRVATAQRVRRLLDAPAQPEPGSRALTWLGAAALSALLWVVA